ncbi:MAG: glucose-6-phosphate isomerase [Planctomycetota bacterium]|nr:MAG: glucose-6-phosphate isomerase [Planctomycetota bacterium]
MALHLDLTGLFAAPGSAHGLTRAAFHAAFPRAAAARAEHLRDLPAWRKLHTREDHLKSCRARALQVLDEQRELEAFVVLGIGGSALGNAALIGALAPVYQEWRPAPGRPRVFVLDSVDPDWIGSFLEAVPAERCHFNVISKSGGTIETSAQFLIFYEAVKRALGSDKEARKRFTVTTDPRSGHFRKLCDELGFASLEVPPGVGGRFSILSPVGLFMAEIAGLDTQGLLEGAARVDQKLAECAPEADPALAWALSQVLFMETGYRITVNFPYSHRLRLLADWFLQLWAESLGKRVARDGREVFAGATPVRAVGPTDQHSQMQLYTEGPHDKVFTMVKVERFERKVEVPPACAASPAFEPLHGRTLNELMEAERLGSEVALRAADRPVCVLELCQVDAFHVGQYFLFFEIATAYAGALLGIDPYDQPGVEAGKKAALALMGAPGTDAPAQAIRQRLRADDKLVLKC